jgi:5-methyltetrahydropteroyltriglutamate--homocysteine methyltransferase
MKRSEQRILTTHVGSLVRPPEIIEAMQASERDQPYDEQAYDRDLKAAVAEVVRLQAQAGVDIVSDGEFGKRGWSQYVAERLGGLEPEVRPEQDRSPNRGPDEGKFSDFWNRYRRLETVAWLPQPAFSRALDARELDGQTSQVGWVCNGPVTYKGHAAVARDIVNFKAALDGVTVEEAFMPVVAPCSVEATRTNRYYASDEEYVYAVADALKEEYNAIVDAGLLLQIDDAWLPMSYSRLLAAGRESEYPKWAGVRVDALNTALKGIPPEKVRYHICWGSQNAPHTDDAPLREVLPLVLAVNASAYLIESANARHEHEWKVWEDVKLPEGKTLIPGVVTHSTNLVEHPELVQWRITNFARLVGRENVIAGTDCGFSQNWNLIRVHPTVQWAKLEALEEGAALASKELWS